MGIYKYPNRQPYKYLKHQIEAVIGAGHIKFSAGISALNFIVRLRYVCPYLSTHEMYENCYH